MQKFITKFEKEIQGVMSGLDRVLFRGSLRRLTHSKGMKGRLAENNILCKKYKDPVKDLSLKLKEAVLEPFQQQKLLVKHVLGRDDKDPIARGFAAETGITEGDVCAFSAMEMAPTFPHDKTDRVIRSRPCPTIYPYRLDPEFGWMHARIQTGFPFSIHVCIHGREWLSRRMNRGRTTLFPPGERLPVGRGHPTSATAFPRATPGELGRSTPALCSATESIA